MLDEIEKFNQPKPAPFAFRIDVRPDKQFNAKNSFGSQLNEILNDIDPDAAASRAISSGADAHESISVSDYTLAQQLNALSIAKELSGMSSGLKFISRQQKLNIELVGERSNFERTDDPAYLSKKKLTDELPKQKLAFESAALAKKQKDKKIEKDAVDTQKDESIEGEGNTYLHNLSLYQRLDNRNPIKTGDTENYDAFEKNKALHPINSQFLSSLQSLEKFDPKLWDTMNTTIADITKKNKNSNKEKITDPYYADSVDKQDMYLDYNGIITTPEVYRKLNNKESFFTVMSAFEDMSRFNAIYANMYGPGPKPAGFSAQDSPEKTVAQQKADAITHAQNWWDKIGSKVKDVPILLTQALIPEIANSLTTNTDWSKVGAAGDSTSKALLKNEGDPRSILVNGYHDFLSQKYLTQFASNKQLSKTDFNLDSTDEVNKVWTKLIEKGFITEEGEITAHFKMEDPAFDLGLGVGADKEAFIQKTVREKYLGKFSFEVQDFDQIKDVGRRNIKIYNESSKAYESLGDITAKINTGNTWQEKVQNTRSAYESLLHIYSTMVGMSTEKDSNGKAVFTAKGESSGAVSVSNKASWQEWNPEDHKVQVKGKDEWVGAWKTVEGEPLKLNFENKDTAQKFTDDILGLSQLLAPVLGLFGGDKLPMITNNGLSEDSIKILGKKDANFRYSITQLNDYNDPVFADAQKLIKDKSTNAIGHNIFEKSQINKMISIRHAKQIKTYEAQKEEFEDDEIDRIKVSNQVEADEKADEQAVTARIERQVKEAAEESRKQGEKIQGENNKNSQKPKSEEEES